MRISDWSSDVCSSDLPDASFVEAARAKGVRIDIMRDAREAVAGADLIVTDTWVSMGQDHAHNKIAAMAPYRVDERLMTGAKGDAILDRKSTRLNSSH